MPTGTRSEPTRMTQPVRYTGTAEFLRADYLGQSPVNPGGQVPLTKCEQMSTGCQTPEKSNAI